MPRVWKPREHSLYRIASIALFRALLTQCRAATLLLPEQRVAAQNIVRNRFKANASEVSVRRTKRMYAAGYHALDLLDASVARDEAATSRIAELLAQTPNALKDAPQQSPKLSREEKKKLRQEAEGHDPTTLACLPEGKKMLDIRPRPQEQLSGKRHVPRFSLAGRTPFLRTKKPQPPNLERVLRQKIEARQRWADYSHALLGFHLPLAEMEDQWDRIVAEHDIGSVSVPWQEPSWKVAAQEELEQVQGRIRNENTRAYNLAIRLQHLQDQERALAAEEEQQREAQAIESPV